MLAAILCNLEVTTTPAVVSGSSGGDWSDVFLWHIANIRKRKRQKVAAQIREEREEVERLRVIAEKIEADPDLEARLQRASMELALLELEAMRARTAELQTILKLAELVAAEIEDEEDLLTLM